MSCCSEGWDLDDGADIIGKERAGQRDGRIEVLSDKEVTMIDRDGVDAHEDLVMLGLGNRHVDEPQAWWQC